MTPYRLAVLSDIHASLTSLKAVLQDLDNFSPLDGILVAGDFTYGPSQTETIQLLRSYPVPVTAVQGNGDVDLLNLHHGCVPDYMYTVKQYVLVRWSYANTTSGALDFLQDLPLQRVFTLPGADPIRIVHGSPGNVNEMLYPEQEPGRFSQVITDIEEPVLVFGHIHWQVKVNRNGKLALNPGAVSMANGMPLSACYAVMEWLEGAYHWQVQFRHVSYEREALRQEFAASGLMDTGPFGRLLLATSLAGSSVGSDYMRRAYALSKAAGYGALPYIPDDIWEQAEASYPWHHLGI